MIASRVIFTEKKTIMFDVVLLGAMGSTLIYSQNEYDPGNKHLTLQIVLFVLAAASELCSNVVTYNGFHMIGGIVLLVSIGLYFAFTGLSLKMIKDNTLRKGDVHNGDKVTVSRDKNRKIPLFYYLFLILVVGGTVIAYLAAVQENLDHRSMQITGHISAVRLLPSFLDFTLSTARKYN